MKDKDTKVQGKKPLTREDVPGLDCYRSPGFFFIKSEDIFMRIAFDSVFSISIQFNSNS